MVLIMAYKKNWQGQNGIINYIYKNYPSIIPEKLDPNQFNSFINKIQRPFLNSIGVKYKKGNEHYETQKHWSKFKKYLSEKY